ncbi:MAG: STAS-like domain-containing protein [Rhodospirillales bacterium]
MFRSEANHLYFFDDTGSDVLPASAALYNLIKRQGYTDIILDFSKTFRFHNSFMVPLITCIMSYRHENIDFDLFLPEDTKGNRLIRNTNWAHLICPEKFDSRTYHNRNHISAIQYLSAEQHFRAVDQTIDIILKTTHGLDRSRLIALEWSLNEITDNVLNHSESPVGGVLQVVTLPKKSRVEFYVCDAGIGIPKSLRQGRPEINDDVRAVRAAINEGVTRNKSTNQGNGLYGTFNCCQVSGGEFDILTGTVLLRSKHRELKVSKNTIPFMGTFVRASINYQFDKLLEKALVFRGHPYVPSFDYIERVFQTLDSDIQFVVRKELESFGSRELGRLARIQIENLMDKATTPILFDFSDVHVISSSFADEVFGKLFIALGPVAFSELCKFKNMEPTVKELIDRAIIQRTV